MPSGTGGAVTAVWRINSRPTVAWSVSFAEGYQNIGFPYGVTVFVADLLYRSFLLIFDEFLKRGNIL